MPGGHTLALELPYFEHDEPTIWTEESSYAGTGILDHPVSMSWNHGLGEIVTAVSAGRPT